MVRISGFFCSHGDFSFNVIPSIVKETQATFANKGENVYIHELFTDGDPTEYASKVVVYQQFSQEMFTRSAKEENLLKSFSECLARHQGNTRLALDLSRMDEGQVREYFSGTYYKRTLWELSKLRREIVFHLLYESGTTPEKDVLMSLRHKAIVKIQSSFGVDFNAHIDAGAEEMRYMLEIALIRNDLVRQVINGLIVEYSELNIQLVFGSTHKDMLEPYRNREDVFLREVTFHEPGITFMTELCDSIMAGNVLTTEGKLALYLWRNLASFSSQIWRVYGVIVHPGDCFDTMRQSVSVAQLKSFFCRDGEEGMIRLTKLLKETGVIDVLGSKNPKAGDCLRILAEKPTGLVVRKPLARDVGRNEPCPCGSGKKYKKCCGK